MDIAAEMDWECFEMLWIYMLSYVIPSRGMDMYMDPQKCFSERVRAQHELLLRREFEGVF